MQSPAFDLLWHYTDINGLLGIIPNGTTDSAGQFHASNIAMMNDFAEVSYGVSKIQDLLRREIVRVANGNSYHEESLSREFLEPFNWQLERHVSRQEHTRSIYSVSLSKHGDQLSQWRGYASEGYAIGFNAATLHAGLNDPHYFDLAMGDRIEVGTVTYLEPHLGDSEDELAGSDDWKHVRRMLIEGRDVGLVYEHIWRTLMFRAAFWKSDSFREEDEVRIVARTNRTPYFKPSPFGPKSYIELPFPARAIEAVVVGPGPQVDAKIAAVQQYTSYLSECNIQVVPSAITYRGQ
ncbi:UNVERIFIED_ORG: hypothetical protein EDC92_12613 [Dietzia maris]